jgi:hypothetical protein
VAGRPRLVTPELAQRAGELRDEGLTVAQVSTALGVSRSSTFRALARTRAERTDVQPRDARDEVGHDTPRPLTEDDVVRLLEAAARRGNVRAMELLLRRFADRPGRSHPLTVIDELAARRG